MMSFVRVCATTIAVLAILCVTAPAARLKLGDKTLDEVIEESKRTGLIQRALRAQLTQFTATGVIRIQFDEQGAMKRAVLLAEDGKTYLIGTPGEMVLPEMNGKRVEMQFAIVKPDEPDVGNIRFLEILRDRKSPVAKAAAALDFDKAFEASHLNQPDEGGEAAADAADGKAAPKASVAAKRAGREDRRNARHARKAQEKAEAEKKKADAAKAPAAKKLGATTKPSKQEKADESKGGKQ